MRRMFYLSFAVLLAACGQSIQEKATKFAKGQMSQSLVGAGGYEAVETTVDSVFNSVFFDTEAVAAATAIAKAEAVKTEAQQTLDEANEAAEKYDGRRSSFSQQQRQFFLDKAAKAQEQIDAALAEIARQQEVVRQRAAAITEEAFCGWAITHNFKGGTTNDGTIHGILLVTDEDMSQLKFTVLLDENEPANLEHIRRVIGQAIGN